MLCHPERTGPQTSSSLGVVSRKPASAQLTSACGCPRSLAVQFHDILYTLSLDILYTSARARASAEVGAMPFKQMELREQRVEFVVRALGSDEPSSRLCQQFGVSRPTGSKSIARYRPGGVEQIAERSRRPHNSPPPDRGAVGGRGGAAAACVSGLRVPTSWSAAGPPGHQDSRRAPCTGFCSATGWCAIRTGTARR